MGGLANGQLCGYFSPLADDDPTGEERPAFGTTTPVETNPVFGEVKAEEHRAALDWLNEITSEGTNFFGVEVELW